MIIEQLIDTFVSGDGSDLYLVPGSCPSIRLNHQIQKVSDTILNASDVEAFIEKTFSKEIKDEFEVTHEYNTAIDWANNTARLRVNLYQQRQMPSIVIRKFTLKVPSIDELQLPQMYKKLAMEARGLTLLVGPTNSGKSTSIAAMIKHRNQHGSGHIVTVEDPVEFIHTHDKCIISQRDVGLDTHSFAAALKNALRQSPEVLYIGEIRERKVMEHALNYAETGHLVLATLHANNTSQAIERIINFFPHEFHDQILLNLSLNLNSIISQRLIRNSNDQMVMAIETMINEGAIKELIQKRKINELRDIIEKSAERGMYSFDQSLLQLVEDKRLSQEEAMQFSDNPANLRLKFKQTDIEERLRQQRLNSSLSRSGDRFDKF